jgi:hypothetical protein
VEPLGRCGDRDDDDEVEEELERGGGPTLLVRVASAHWGNEVRVDRAPQRALAHWASLWVRDDGRFWLERGWPV